jgi:hypothetical protein
VPVINLLRTAKEEGNYELLLAKRGKRAGATHLEGDRTNLIYLKHSKDSILWEQRPTPVVIAPAPKPKAKAKAAPNPKVTKEELSKLRKDAGTKQIKDLDGFIARITEPMAKCEIYRIGEANGHGSVYVLRKNWSQIEARLVKTKNKYQQIPSK